MVTQACWERDSPLLQVPHITKDLATAAGKAGVESIFDLADMEVIFLKSSFVYSLRVTALTCVCFNAFPQQTLHDHAARQRTPSRPVKVAVVHNQQRNVVGLADMAVLPGLR